MSSRAASPTLLLTRARTKPVVIVALRIGLLLLLASVGSLSAASSGVSDAELQKMLRTRVDLQKKGTGIVIGMIDGQARRISSYGTLSLENKRPMDGETVFEIGSITKVFTALLLADMAQRGEVALNDPIAKYLPGDLHLSAGSGREITLADLATHTSGLPLRPTNLIAKDPENPYAGYTTELLDRFVSGFRPTPPGRHYGYSNVGYGLLGQALARRAGMSFDDLVRTRITAPLQMKSTGVALAPALQERMATGYSSELKPAARWDFGALESAGALHATANDLLNLLEAFLGNRKSDLHPAMEAMLQTRRPGGMQPATEIALAWNVFSEEGREIAWKNGSVGGSRAFLGYDPKAHRGIVALTNAQTAVGADDIALHWLNPNVPVDFSIPKPHHEVTIDRAQLDRCAGRYRYSPTDVITVTRVEGHLVVAPSEGGKLDFFPEGERDFFARVLDVQLTFVVQPNELATAAIWHQGGTDQRGERIPAEEHAPGPP